MRDAAPVEPSAGTSACGDQGVERTVLCAEHPWVPPRLVVPSRSQPVVPTRIALDERARDPLPSVQIVAHGKANPLDEPPLSARDTGVEQVPAVVVSDHRPRPGGQVVPRGPRRGCERVGSYRPVEEIPGDRMADRRMPVTAVRVLQVARCLQVEQVEHAGVLSHPEVPDPLVRKSQRHGDDRSRDESPRAMAIAPQRHRGSAAHGLKGARSPAAPPRPPPPRRCRPRSAHPRAGPSHPP